MTRSRMLADGDAAQRHFEAGIGYGGGDAVARLAYSGIGQAYDDDERFSISVIHLDLDRVSGNSLDGSAMGFG